jgi:hypothetical protein
MKGKQDELPEEDSKSKREKAPQVLFVASKDQAEGDERT